MLGRGRSCIYLSVRVMSSIGSSSRSTDFLALSPALSLSSVSCEVSKASRPSGGFAPLLAVSLWKVWARLGICKLALAFRLRGASCEFTREAGGFLSDGTESELLEAIAEAAARRRGATQVLVAMSSSVVSSSYCEPDVGRGKARVGRFKIVHKLDGTPCNWVV